MPKRLSSKIRTMLIAALWCSAALACWADKHARTIAQVSTGKPAPHIVLDSDRFDFGTIDEGVEVKHTFQVRNAGTALLRLFSAYSSCGCTIAKIEKKQLEPGESTNISVSVDTAMKQNKVTKTVSVCSNDGTTPVVTLFLSMNVKDPHTGMKEQDGAKIFTDQRCASCHVDRGFGLFGSNLYNADCAMCHGPKAEGAVGPALFGPYDDAKFAAHMKDVLEHGSKVHRSMPGFLAESGGPLAQEQVDSIIKYLHRLSKAREGKGTL
ncbi:MAG TPA: DUF1573 domain-containing protein [Trichormus sp.]